jgi:CelD/BcsL family acetyltransferase involved in cellulose biosynthesis
MKRAFKGRAIVHVSRSSPYPTMRIDASWREPESHFNAGRRSDLRRALRAAEKHGTVTMEVLTPEPAALDGLLQEALDAELHSWKGAAGTALLLDPLRLEIYRHYLAALAQKGDLRLAFLRIDGKAVAMQIVAETSQRLWLMKIGHNEAYSKCSPGTLLMLHLARYAAERGLVAIEFLGAAEAWTRFWTEDLEECVQVRVYPPSLGSITALGFDAWCSARTRVRRSLKRGQT